MNVKDDLIEHKYLCWNKDYQKKFDENLQICQFANTYKFSNHDINKFILPLRKAVYSYEYMDDWEKFNKTSLPRKYIYTHLKMEDSTNADYTHTKRVRKDFKINNLENIMICVWKVIHYCKMMYLTTFRNKCL